MANELDHFRGWIRHELMQLIQHEPQLLRRALRSDASSLAGSSLEDGGAGGADSGGADSGAGGSDTGGDSMTPTYLTLSPTGQVGAAFTGLVNALGLVLPASTNFTPTNTNTVSWTTDGTQSGGLIAEMFGYGPVSGNEFFTIRGLEEVSGDASGGNLAAIDRNGVIQASIGVQQQNAGAGPLLAGAVVGAGSLSQSILLSDGSSDYLQLGSHQNIKLSFGTASGLAAGAAGFTDLTVPLGFTWPTAHKLFLAVINTASVNVQQVFSTRCRVINASNGGIGVVNNNAAGQNLSVFWLSLGN